MDNFVKIITSKAVQYLVLTFCAIMMIDKLKETYKDYYDSRMDGLR